ncbi:Hipa protein [Cupriavidus sp. H18C1]
MGPEGDRSGLQSTPPRCHRLSGPRGEDRIGALGFCMSDGTYNVEHPVAFHRGDLHSLLEAAQALELQLPIDERLRQLLRPGGTAGGARPKATIDDDGRAWIAKFPAQGDDVDFCAVEHASLRLAADCGIHVPESRLLRLDRFSVLLVARFDRQHDGSRVHFASARTMLMAEGIAEPEMSYADIAEVARRFSPTPVDDSRQVFRRMVFNILIENTDDHAKNHAFLHSAGQAMRLAPAYDLQPQLQGLHYHQLVIGDQGSEPSLANALSQASRFMLSEQEAHAEVERLIDRVAKWRTVFEQSGVRPHDIEACAPYMMRDTRLPARRTRRRP